MIQAALVGRSLRAGAWPAVVGLSAAAAVIGGVAGAVPRAGVLLLPACFALLGAAAACTLDEPAVLVVDVTPTSASRRTAVRALALLLPLTVGIVTGLAAARRTGLPGNATALALVGTVVLGFTVACLVRTRTGEPGAAAATLVVLAVLAPAFVPRVPTWLRTVPQPAGHTQPSNALWLVTLVAGAALIAATLTNRAGPRFPRWPPTRGAMFPRRGPTGSLAVGPRWERISEAEAKAVLGDDAVDDALAELGAKGLASAEHYQAATEPSIANEA